METIAHSLKPQRLPSDRSFGAVMAIFFSFLSLLPWIQSRQQPNFVLLAIALIFGALAALLPRALRPLNIVWTKLGLLLHKITNPLILGIIFFLVITPIGLLMRITGHDPLRKKFDKNAASYWIQRKATSPKTESMKNQF